MASSLALEFLCRVRSAASDWSMSFWSFRAFLNRWFRPISSWSLDRFRQGRPGAFFGRAFEAGFDEGDAHPAVIDIGVLGAVAGEFFARLPFAHVGFEAAMEAGEGAGGSLRRARP